MQKMQEMAQSPIRIGTVMDVDDTARMVRVRFDNLDGLISGWLKVLQHFEAGIYVTPDGTPMHEHAPSYVTYWMPKVNDIVVAVYLPVFNADGFVIGGVC